MLLAKYKIYVYHESHLSYNFRHFAKCVPLFTCNIFMEEEIDELADENAILQFLFVLRLYTHNFI